MVEVASLEGSGWLKNLRVIISKYWIPAITENDEDRLIIIEGKEGSSKSTLALHVAILFLKGQGKELNIDSIHYNVNSLTDAILLSKKGDIQIVDEGALLGFSRDAMTKNTKNLVKVLTTCRSKNNLILICIPTIKLLDKYLKEHRVAGVLRVVRRGSVHIYNGMKWKQSQYREKYSKKMKVKRSNIVDFYPKVERLWGREIWQKYLDHKHEQLKNNEATNMNNPKGYPAKALYKRDRMIVNMHINGMKIADIARICDLTASTISLILKKSKYLTV